MNSFGIFMAPSADGVFASENQPSSFTIDYQANRPLYLILINERVQFQHDQSGATLQVESKTNAQITKIAPKNI